MKSLYKSPVLDTDARIKQFVLFSSATTRTALADNLSLPAPTVASAVRRLIASGELVAVDLEEGRATRGRGEHRLKVPGAGLAIGLIRWKSRGLSVELLAGESHPLHCETVPLPEAHGGAEGLDRAAEALLNAAAKFATHEIRAIVVSLPGPILRGSGSPPEHLSTPESPKVFRVDEPTNLDHRLSARHGIPVITENDANLAALAELHAGPRDRGTFIYLNVGLAGVGSALVLNGQLVRGAHGYGGELAHLQLDRNGGICNCGGRGCLWTKVQEISRGESQGNLDDPFMLTELDRLAGDGHEGSRRVLTDIGRLVGQPIGHLCTFIDPQCVIVGNELTAVTDNVISGLQESMRVDAPPAVGRRIRIERSAISDDPERHGAFEILREQARLGAVS